MFHLSIFINIISIKKTKAVNKEESCPITKMKNLETANQVRDKQDLNNLRNHMANISV